MSDGIHIDWTSEMAGQRRLIRDDLEVGRCGLEFDRPAEPVLLLEGEGVEEIDINSRRPTVRVRMTYEFAEMLYGALDEIYGEDDGD